MTRRNFLFVLAVIAFVSTATWAQVPDKAKVVAGAERAFEKFAKAYVAPGAGGRRRVQCRRQQTEVHV